MDNGTNMDKRANMDNRANMENRANLDIRANLDNRVVWIIRINRAKWATMEMRGKYVKERFSD